LTRRSDRRYLPQQVGAERITAFYSHVRLHSGPARVRRFLPDRSNRIWTQQIDPG
jgi:hypothetical protein